MRAWRRNPNLPGEEGQGSILEEVALDLVDDLGLAQRYAEERIPRLMCVSGEIARSREICMRKHSKS